MGKAQSRVTNGQIVANVDLFLVKGTNYDRVLAFYEKLGKNFDALVTLVGESDKLVGFVIIKTINKLQVEPDLVTSDDQWEEWSMEVLISNLKKWLRKNKVDDP